MEAAIEEMQPGLPDIEIDTTIFRPATFVEVAIENLTKSLLIGAILVVLVLLLFLWEWRIALDQRHDHPVDGGDHLAGALAVWHDPQCDGAWRGW